MKRTPKKLLSLLMILAMALTLLPMTALADTEVSPFNLSAAPPWTGSTCTNVTPVDEYGYSISPPSLGISTIQTKWTYIDSESVEHTLDPLDEFLPETVYTVHATVILSTGNIFPDPPELSFEGEPVTTYEEWNPATPYKVTVSYTYPATNPLFEVTEARMKAVEPLFGANPDFAPELESGSNFEIIDIEWLDGDGNSLTASDTFTTGNYSLYVTVKPLSICYFAEPDAMEGSFGEITWHDYILTDVTYAADPNNRVLSYTWTVPEPVSTVSLTIPKQAYGETPVMTGSPDYWDHSYPYYVDASEVKWIDETSAELAADAILTSEHSYSVVLNVYPARGNTFADTVSADVNGNPGSVVHNVTYLTVTAPVMLSDPVGMDTVEITLDPGMEVGKNRSWGEVPAYADYSFVNARWFDQDDNEYDYDFIVEAGQTYKAQFEINADLSFAFYDAADMKVLIDGEYADEVKVSEDHRFLTAYKTYEMPHPWMPIVIPEETFDLTEGSIAKTSGDFETLKATMDAFHAAGKVIASTDSINMFYDLDMDGNRDLCVGPDPDDAAYDLLSVLDSCSISGEKAIAVDAADETYLNDILASSYYENVKFVIPLPVVMHTVTFDANGHGSAPAPVSVEHDAAVGCPADPIPEEGWTFGGWFADEACLTAYDFSAPVLADTTIYAKWTEVTAAVFTVTFDADGGEGAMEAMTVDESGKLVLPDCTFTAPEGKVFDAWNFGAPGDEIEVTADLTITAIWKDKTGAGFTLTFDADGGEGAMDALTVADGEKLVLPECGFTAPKGKVFDCWDAGKPGDEIEVAADLTVKAIWKVFNPFEDIFETDYYYDAVLWAYYAEPFVTNGMDATHFGPATTVKREHAVTFLWRAMGEPEPETAENPFVDVKESDYFYKAVLWAVEKGITKGTDATHFTPQQTCSTAHIITFLYRTLGIGEDGWYAVAEAWAIGAKLLDGLDVSVAPGVDCPRADVVYFLFRAIK